MDQLPFCIFFKLKGVFHLSLLLCMCVFDVFVSADAHVEIRGQFSLHHGFWGLNVTHQSFV